MRRLQKSRQERKPAGGPEAAAEGAGEAAFPRQCWRPVAVRAGGVDFQASDLGKWDKVDGAGLWGKKRVHIHPDVTVVHQAETPVGS